MSELSEKRHLTVDEVGIVDAGHVDKKLKLSTAGEPLTKKDLKLFQKDVLYRNLKEYKLKYYALKETIKLNQDIIELKEQYEKLFHELERDNSKVVQRVMGKPVNDGVEILKEEEKEQSFVSPISVAASVDVVPPSASSAADGDNKHISDVENLKSDLSEAHFDLKLNDLQTVIDGMNLKLASLQKSSALTAEELKQKNTKCEEQNFLLENNKIENHSLKTQLDSYITQFTKLTEDYKLLLKNLNSAQINPGPDTIATAAVPDKFNETLKNINESLLTDMQSLQKNLARVRAERDHLRSNNNLLTCQTKDMDSLKALQKDITIIKNNVANFEKTHGSVTSDNELLEELKSIELAYNMLAETKLDSLNKTIVDKQQMEKKLIDYEKLKEKYASISRLLQDYKVEIDVLKKVKYKSDELISDYEIRERVSKGKINNLEKQLGLSREIEKFCQLTNNQQLSKVDVLDKEIAFLKTALQTKDTMLAKTAHEIENFKTAKQDLEHKVLESSDMLAKHEKKHKSLILKLKQASEKISNPNLATYIFGSAQLSEINSGGNDPAVNGGSSSGLKDQLNNFKQLVYCPLCTLNFKNKMIKNCGHTFCDNCIKERLGARMRKCPSCNLPFGSTDVHDIVL
ncbi:hypothetical protein QEN19_002688 [Hanseniaspora menglaensis]